MEKETEMACSEWKGTGMSVSPISLLIISICAILLVSLHVRVTWHAYIVRRVYWWIQSVWSRCYNV